VPGLGKLLKDRKRNVQGLANRKQGGDKVEEERKGEAVLSKMTPNVAPEQPMRRGRFTKASW